MACCVPSRMTAASATALLAATAVALALLVASAQSPRARPMPRVPVEVYDHPAVTKIVIEGALP